MDFELILILVIEFFLFIAIAYGFKYIINYLNKKDDRYLKVTEYIPIEEYHSIKQVYYLSMMTLILIDIIFVLIFGNQNLLYYALFDFMLTIIIFENMPDDTVLDKIKLFLLVPFSSMLILISGSEYLAIMDLIRIAGMFFAMKYFYQRFISYTRNNGLGVTILLLFAIIFFSFFFTSFIEEVSLLDALVMSSNAFTSNGYAILGHTVFGKVNALLLVWSGYVLSGVGTATLTVSLMIKYYDKKFKHMEQLINELKKE